MKLKVIFAGLSIATITPHMIFDPAVASSQHKESLTLDKIDILLESLQKATPDGAGDQKRFPISYHGIMQSKEFIKSLSNKNYVPDEEHIKSFLTTYIVASRVMNSPNLSLEPVPGSTTQMFVLEKSIKDTAGKYTSKTNVRYSKDDRTLSGIQGHLDSSNKFVIDKTEKISVDDVMKAFTRFRSNIRSQGPVTEKKIFAHDQGVLFFKTISGNQILFVKSSDEKGEEKIYATNSPEFPDHEEITKSLFAKLGIPMSTVEKRLAGRIVAFKLTDRKARFLGKEYPVVEILKSIGWIQDEG